MLISLLIPREQHDEQVSSPVVLCKINRNTLDRKGESSDEISAKNPKKIQWTSQIASTRRKLFGDNDVYQWAGALLVAHSGYYGIGRGVFGGEGYNGEVGG